MRLTITTDNPLQLIAGETAEEFGRGALAVKYPVYLQIKDMPRMVEMPMTLAEADALARFLTRLVKKLKEEN